MLTPPEEDALSEGGAACESAGEDEVSGDEEFGDAGWNQAVLEIIFKERAPGVALQEVDVADLEGYQALEHIRI
jgi:hypothetical protein